MTTPSPAPASRRSTSALEVELWRARSRPNFGGLVLGGGGGGGGRPDYRFRLCRSQIVQENMTNLTNLTSLIKSGNFDNFEYQISQHVNLTKCAEVCQKFARRTMTRTPYLQPRTLPTRRTPARAAAPPLLPPAVPQALPERKLGIFVILVENGKTP